MAGADVCGPPDAMNSCLSLIAAHSRNRCIGIGGGKYQIMPLHAYHNLRRYKRSGKWFFRKDAYRNPKKQLHFPLHLPKDLQRFKRLTMDKPIIMGKNTYLSMGRALPGRYNIVLSRRLTRAYPETMLCATLEDACDLADRINDLARTSAFLGDATQQPPDLEPDSATYLKYKGEIGKASGQGHQIPQQNAAWQYMPRPIADPRSEDQKRMPRATQEIMVIGGASIYDQALAWAQRLYVTIVDAQIDGDVFFPAYQLAHWQVRRQEQGVDGGWGYRFLILERLAG